jgi:hypothetical protein
MGSLDKDRILQYEAEIKESQNFLVEALIHPWILEDR